MEIAIETTADGSPTFYRPDLDEHYHSTKGALAESLHVYLECGWRRAAVAGRPVSVFEVGFGTGLNAAITARAALEDCVPTIYHSIELYPLTPAFTDLFSGATDTSYRSELLAVNHAPWDEFSEINPFFTLHKIHADLLTSVIPEGLDAVYFDAFAPEKQPEMWDEEIMRKLYTAMRPAGVLTTYCSKGEIRRMLNRIGFTTERLAGPPGGKREILRATVPAEQSLFD